MFDKGKQCLQILSGETGNFALEWGFCGIQFLTKLPYI